MIFGEPKMLFGKNIPQTLYTYSFDAIGIERSWGIGLNLGKGFEFRATQHFLFKRLGARDTNLGRGGPWAEWALGAVQHCGDTEIFWDTAVVMAESVRRSQELLAFVLCSLL